MSVIGPLPNYLHTSIKLIHRDLIKHVCLTMKFIWYQIWYHRKYNILLPYLYFVQRKRQPLPNSPYLAFQERFGVTRHWCLLCHRIAIFHSDIPKILYICHTSMSKTTKRVIRVKENCSFSNISIPWLNTFLINLDNIISLHVRHQTLLTGKRRQLEDLL